MADVASSAPSATPPATELPRQKKKPPFPVSVPLRSYLTLYRRERLLPVTYERLRHFTQGYPLHDAAGRNTLWEHVVYEAIEQDALHEDLKAVYAQLRVNGDLSFVRHLYVDRIDYCAFGNSAPFRIRIVNRFNDNADYFYVKRGDASRIYGLELEHLLSPFRLNYFTHGDTLIEEHVAGVPGDVFITQWLERKELSPVRVAKELIKFNERCFIRLLGDMRSYNFVAIITPDFEGTQIRFRAMDFDQQSYEGRKNFYLPQFFADNRPLALFCLKQLRYETARQYQREEHTLLLQRAGIIEDRLALLLNAMSGDTLAPPEHFEQLRDELAEHFGRTEYRQCRSMGDLVRENLTSIREESVGPLMMGGFADLK